MITRLSVARWLENLRSSESKRMTVVLLPETVKKLKLLVAKHPGESQGSLTNAAIMAYEAFGGTGAIASIKETSVNTTPKSKFTAELVAAQYFGKEDPDRVNQQSASFNSQLNASVEALNAAGIEVAGIVEANSSAATQIKISLPYGKLTDNYSVQVEPDGVYWFMVYDKKASKITYIESSKKIYVIIRAIKGIVKVLALRQ